MNKNVKSLHKLIRTIPNELFQSFPENEAFVFKNYKFVPIELLVPAVWNYKNDDSFMAEQLLNNIKRKGQIVTCQIRLLDTGYYEIVDGNHRYIAFKELDYKFVICYDHGDITEAEAIRHSIETNETNFKSDNEKLSKILTELSTQFEHDDLFATLPFKQEDFDSILKSTTDTLEHALDTIEEDNFEQELPKIPKTKKGDIYELNQHRMLCGDSTSLADVSTLMNNQLAHMLHTDPPYNINYPAFNLNRATEHAKDWTDSYCSEWKDNMSHDDYVSFLSSFILNAKKFMFEWAHYYVWHASIYYRELLDTFDKLEIPYDKVPIQWVKQVAPLSWVRYKRISEPCVFAGKGAVNGNGEGARWFGPNNEVNVWQISREHNGNYIHPTQKPIALPSRAILNSSQKGEIVLDLFLGSGSTLIAADILERNCYGMELEPIFCDVIVQRFISHCKQNNKECVVKLNGNIIDHNYFDEDSNE